MKLNITESKVEQLYLIFPNATEQELEEKVSNIITDFFHMNEIREDIFAYDHLQLALVAMADANNIGNEIWQEYLVSIEEFGNLTAKDLITAAYAFALLREVNSRKEALCNFS